MKKFASWLCASLAIVALDGSFVRAEGPACEAKENCEASTHEPSACSSESCKAECPEKAECSGKSGCSEKSGTCGDAACLTNAPKCNGEASNCDGEQACVTSGATSATSMVNSFREKVPLELPCLKWKSAGAESILDSLRMANALIRGTSLAEVGTTCSGDECCTNGALAGTHIETPMTFTLTNSGRSDVCDEKDVHACPGSQSAKSGEGEKAQSDIQVTDYIFLSDDSDSYVPSREVVGIKEVTVAHDYTPSPFPSSESTTGSDALRSELDTLLHESGLSQLEVPVAGNTFVRLLVDRIYLSAQLEMSERMMAERNIALNQIHALAEQNAKLASQAAVAEVKQQMAEALVASMEEKAALLIKQSSPKKGDAEESNAAQARREVQMIREDLSNIRRQMALLRQKQPVPFATSEIGRTPPIPYVPTKQAYSFEAGSLR